LENLFVLFCHKPMFDFVGEIHFCKQEIVWVTIQFSLPICVLAGKLKSLKFSVNIDRYVKIHAIFFLWVCVCEFFGYYTVVYLLIFWDFIIPMLSWLCLTLSSVCKIPLSVFLSAGCVVIYSLIFCLFQIFTSPSIRNDSFAG
jgi:hypothetical protein